MASTAMNKKHFHFGSDFKIFLMSMIFKMQITILKNDLKGLILGTDTDKIYCFLGFGDPPARMHPPCHFYLLFSYCPTNPSYTNMFNQYIYMAVEDRKSANLFVLSDQWNSYNYVKESGSANQPKEMDVEKVVTVSEEGMFIKSTVEKATEITKDDAKPSNMRRT